MDKTDWVNWKREPKDNRKVAVYTGTKNLYLGMEASAKSLVANSDVDEVWFLIEDDEFPRPLPDIVHVMNVKPLYRTFFPDDGPNMRSRYTYMALMRAALCYLFPDLPKILSLDCDLHFVADVSEIWNLPLGDEYYLSASREPNRSKNGLLYVNVGVALYNLDKLRDGKGDEVISALNRNQYDNLEQDAFSYLCSSRILDMPACYNCNPFTSRVLMKDLKCVHYAGMGQEWLNQPDIVRWHKTPWSSVLDMRKGPVSQPPESVHEQHGNRESGE